jgi:translation initiation factor eIF-2B subunit delta
VNPRIIKGINKIQSDRIHGASWLSLQAISTLNTAVSCSQAVTIADFIQEIKTVAEELTRARPSITPIANYANQFLHQIVIDFQKETDVASAKSCALITGKELLKSAVKALSKTVEYGRGIIGDLDTVITCSYSSTVCKVLEVSMRRETKFRVIVAESRLEDNAYGQITAEQLMKSHIPTEMVSDKNIPLRISKADTALVGADSITADGYLINGKPTSILAQAARDKMIPLYVVCESAKFDIHGYIAKSLQIDPGFDKTPLNLVTGIITEKGTMQPNLVIAYIEEKTAEMARLSI